MSKYCQRCRFENPDDTFWCQNCNTKIINNVVQNTQHHIPHYLEQENKKPRTSTEQHHPKKFLKLSIVSCMVVLPCILGFILFNGFNFTFGYHDEFLGINCQINQDFWFEGNYLNTSEGWSFTLRKVKEYTLEGRILGLKTYGKNDIPYDPCNIFSPIDLVIGIDTVQTNPDKYDYSITSFEHRKVSWHLYNDDSSDYYYFKSHTGNNHIIPHTKAVLDLLKNISINDIVILKGSLIDLYGINGNQYWEWTTDTIIGNYDCEIILVDEIEVLKSN